MFGHLPLLLLSIFAAVFDSIQTDRDSSTASLQNQKENQQHSLPITSENKGVEKKEVAAALLQKRKSYASIDDILLPDGTLKDDDCEDMNENCSWWKEIGECEKNPGYLLKHCKSSCNFCRADAPKKIRCYRDPNEPTWVKAPGGLNAMFERIVNDPVIQQTYHTKILSKDPWILQFENFVSQKEADNIFEMLGDNFEGSTVVGALDDDGVIERQTLNTRTSHNAWCNLEPCVNSLEHRSIQQRITDLTGAPSYAMEDMQVLNYDPGQFYFPHHDTITDQIPLLCGPRMLTAFVYFTDGDESTGGATRFTRLGLKVYPKKGRMILWPSQKDENHKKVDHRTEHEAMNVTSGNKRAGNIWVHEFNYKKASHLGCAG